MTGAREHDADVTAKQALAARCGNAHVHGDIERVLLTREQIRQRIHELAQDISRDLDLLRHDEEVMLLPILTGSVIFVADLMRELPHKIRMAVVTVSSYPGHATRSSEALITGALPPSFAGQHVIIIDDVLDSGRTIRLIRRQVEQRGARTVRACVLLRKKISSAMETPCEYVGFDIDDEFVVGYGLDYNNYYRNLPEVGTLKRDAMG